WRKSDPKIREQMIYGLTSAGGARFARKKWENDTELFHFHVAPAMWLVDKVVDIGCHGIVTTGIEGGGHQSYEEITTMVLLQEACEKYPEKLIIACGGIANPRGIAAALTMGADAVAMGTRFIASKESEFHPNYKALLPPATDKDTMLTTGGFGPIRLLKNKYCLEHGRILSKEEKLLQEKKYQDIELLKEDLRRYEIVYTEGDVENGAIPAGQSCGLIDSIIYVEDIISSYTKKAEELLKAISSRVY
ncbi:MAG: NAD(P)H-dependent flavin oxidoreductase, partial [Promethearchaeota archaeon]